MGDNGLLLFELHDKHLLSVSYINLSISNEGQASQVGSAGKRILLMEKAQSPVLGSLMLSKKGVCFCCTDSAA